MRFGVCCAVEEATRVFDAGFDYVEVAAAGFQGLEPDWDEKPFRGLPIEATNVFFPGQIRLIGSDRTDHLEYSRRTVGRAARLGVKLMVIGSGGSRRAPQGIDGDVQFARIAEQIQEIASPYGITIAPESLNRTETNTGNDLRTLALLLKERNVAYTADSYHVLYEWDADGQKVEIKRLWTEQLPFAPAHVHLARLLGRKAPGPKDAQLSGFVERLKELGYDSRVSLECSRPEGFDYRTALRDVRELFGV